MPDARIDLGTDAYEADTLPIELPPQLCSAHEKTEVLSYPIKAQQRLIKLGRLIRVTLVIRRRDMVHI